MTPKREPQQEHTPLRHLATNVYAQSTSAQQGASGPERRFPSTSRCTKEIQYVASIKSAGTRSHLRNEFNDDDDHDLGSSVPSFSNKRIKKGFTTTTHCDDNETSFLISRFWKNPDDDDVLFDPERLASRVSQTG
jgi:hypothetical protein